MAEYLGNGFGPSARGNVPAPSAASPVIPSAAPADDLDRQLREQASAFMDRKAAQEHALNNQLEGQGRLHRRIEVSKEPLAEQVARGVGHGALNVVPSLLGLPHTVGDLGVMGWNAVVPEDKKLEPLGPTASPDWFAGKLESLGHDVGLPIDRPPPRSAMSVPERYASDFTENLGTALIPGLGWQKGAGALTNFARGASESVGSVLGGEVAKGVGAGPFGEFLGNVFGGGAGRAGANLADSLAGITARRRGPSGIEDPSKPGGAGVFSSPDTYRGAGDLQAAIRSGGGNPQEVLNRISGYIDTGSNDYGTHLTTGQGPVSADPTLRSLDAWARREDPSAFHAQDRAALNESFGPMYLNRDRTVNADAFGAEAEQRRNYLEALALNPVQNAESAVDMAKWSLGQITPPLAPDLRSTQNALHATIDDSRKAALSHGNSLYRDIPAVDPASGLDIVLPLTHGGQQTLGPAARLPRHQDTPFADAVGRLQGVSSRLVGDEAQQYQALAQHLQDIVSGGEARISDLVRLDSGLGDFIERASRANNPVLAGAYAKSLADVKAGLRQEYDLQANSVPSNAGPGLSAGIAPVVGDQALTAKKFWAQQWSPNFNEGPGGAFDAGMRNGSQLPENSGRGFIKTTDEPGSAASAAQLRSIIDLGAAHGVPLAQSEQAVRDYLVRSLHESAGSGSITPAHLQQWGLDHRDILEKFPTVEAELAAFKNRLMQGHTDVAASAESLRMAEKDKALRLKLLARDPISAVAGADGPNVVAAILGSKNPEITMRSLVSQFQGNPAALDSLKAAVQDHIWKATTSAGTQGAEALPSLAGLRTMVERHDKALREILSPEEMSYLNRARNVATSLSDIKSAIPQDITRSGTAGQGVGSVLQAMMRYRYGILRTGGLLKTMKDLKTGLGLGGELSGPVMDRLITRAMVDPAVAKRLLETNVDANGFIQNSTPAASVISGALRDNPDGREMRDRPLKPFRAGDW